MAAAHGAEVYLGHVVPAGVAKAGRGTLRWAHTVTAGVAPSLPQVAGTGIVLTNSAAIHAEPIADWTLAAIGYEHVPDPQFPDYPFFGWPSARAPRTFNLHICQSGTEMERRHLAFRDRLRSDPAARVEYAALKRELALKHGNDIEGYNADKDAFIKARS